MRIFRHRHPSLKTLLGVTAAKKQMKRFLGITALLKLFRKWISKIRKIKLKIKWESDTGCVIRHGLPTRSA